MGLRTQSGPVIPLLASRHCMIAPSCKVISTILVAFVPISMSLRRHYEYGRQSSGLQGQVQLYCAGLTDGNTSPALANLLGKVTTLTNNNNLLQNADGGPGGVGATFRVPKSGDFSDGVLSPGDLLMSRW